MGGLAVLARQLGHRVTGCDIDVYPPMSTLLEEAGIEIIEGWDPRQLDIGADLIVIGNAMSRGNPLVEHILTNNLPYISGPQWLAEQLLHKRHVLAVAGTHGKTTTSSLLAWIMECAGRSPGFLIGGQPENFGVSARLGEGDFFIIEADEYDTAFFDKRSKFVHYHARTLILNNLEFDHADIFKDLSDIQRQFHHLVRTVPGDGLIIYNKQDKALQEVLEMGCWTPLQTFGDKGDLSAKPLVAGGSEFQIHHNGELIGAVAWDQVGRHNMLNALAAIAAANHIGVGPEQSIAALQTFRGVKRRMELRYVVGGITVYDDFAHHPTAIKFTLEGQRNHGAEGRVIAVLDLCSNTMRMGVHERRLAAALAPAELVFIHAPRGLAWDPRAVCAQLGEQAQVCSGVDQLVSGLLHTARAGDRVIIMSNGSFGGIYDKLEAALKKRFPG